MKIEIKSPCKEAAIAIKELSKAVQSDELKHYLMVDDVIATHAGAKSVLPLNLLPYYECIVNNFLLEAKERDESDYQPKYEGRPYYHKWTSIFLIANQLNVSSSVARYNLTKLEKLGFVEAKRECNYILWAAKNIDGFEQMIFADYYWRSLI